MKKNKKSKKIKKKTSKQKNKKNQINNKKISEATNSSEDDLAMETPETNTTQVTITAPVTGRGRGQKVIKFGSKSFTKQQLLAAVDRSLTDVPIIIVPCLIDAATMTTNDTLCDN